MAVGTDYPAATFRNASEAPDAGTWKGLEHHVEGWKGKTLDGDNVLVEKNLAEMNYLATGQFPSVGSASHFSGDCRRCCFFPKGRCTNGQSCEFCHFEHDKISSSKHNKQRGEKGRGQRGNELALARVPGMTTARPYALADPAAYNRMTPANTHDPGSSAAYNSGIAPMAQSDASPVAYDGGDVALANSLANSAACKGDNVMGVNTRENFGFSEPSVGDVSWDITWRPAASGSLSGSTVSGTTLSGTSSSRSEGESLTILHNSARCRPPCESPTCTDGILPRCPLCGRSRNSPPLLAATDADGSVICAARSLF